VFRKDLERRLKAIFGFKKVTFSAPADDSAIGTFEQDTGFVEISDCQSSAGFGSARAKVECTLRTFTQDDKMPYGFLTKKIQQAKAELTDPLFFYEIDTNVASSPARIQNIHERRTRFQFLYSEQYDPDQGSITSLELEEQSA
jgi:hypothetical protein